jgi:hypothetical protein
MNSVVIGACQVRLHLSGCLSLKEKRGRLKPLLARLHKEFNISAAETDLNDVWQSAEITLATVANDAGRVQAELQKIVAWIEHNRPEVEVQDAQIELR